MSARGEYRKSTGVPSGAKDLEALAQELAELLRQVSDPFELAAHLEVLGYNRYRVERTFGLPSTFALAQALFARARRDFRPKAKAPAAPGVLGLRHLAMALSLAGSLGVFLQTQEVGWLPALFLLTWSQLAARASLRAAVELDQTGAHRVVAALAWLGLLGLSLAAPLDRGPWTSWSVGAVWVGVGILGLAGRERQAAVLALAFLLGVGLAWVLAFSPLWIGPPTVLVALGQLPRPRLEAFSFLARALQEEWPYGLYGLGQGLILWQLVTLLGSVALLGLALYLLSALLVEMRLGAFVKALGKTLWSKARPNALLLAVQRAFWNYALAALLPTFLLLAALPWVGGYAEALMGFGFLTLTSAMALGLNALGGARSSAYALIAGALLLQLTQNPLVLGAVGLLLLLIFLEHLRHPERYGVYLL